MSTFQNNNETIYLFEKLIAQLDKVDSLLNEGLLREQTPLEEKTLHGEADQELLNYERKTLRKLKRTILDQINEIIAEEKQAKK